MKISIGLLMLAAIIVALSSIVGCSVAEDVRDTTQDIVTSENKHTGEGEFRADDQTPIKKGAVRVEIECCEKKDFGLAGERWVGSAVIENDTDKDFLGISLEITFLGYDDITVPESYTDAKDVPAGQKVRAPFYVESIDYQDIASLTIASMAWDDVNTPPTPTPAVGSPRKDSGTGATVATPSASSDTTGFLLRWRGGLGPGRPAHLRPRPFRPRGQGPPRPRSVVGS